MILLKYFNKIFIREEFISMVFGDDYDGYDCNVDIYVKNIR